MGAGADECAICTREGNMKGRREMKKMKLIPLAALAVATAFALYGCGGGGQQSQTSADESSAAPAETSAAVAAPAPAETSAAVEASAAPAAATSDVDPELIAAGDELKGLVSQYVEQVNKALESGDVDPYEDAIDEIQAKINTLVEKITGLVPTDDPNNPNTVYYSQEIAPIVLRDYADAAFAYADALMAKLEK